MRLPRKLKKKAKKRKAFHDAMIMTQTAMLAVMGRSQVAMVAATPIRHPSEIALKALRVAEVLYDTAQAVSKCMSQIKHYREFA